MGEITVQILTCRKYRITMTARVWIPWLSLLILLFGCGESEVSEPAAVRPEYVLVIHGGAGAISKNQMTPALEEAYRRTLDSALSAGETLLDTGGSAMDAVVAAIRLLEDSELFNAGRGAVFNHDGENELDASIMDGKTLAAGAVAGVRRIRNPILAALAVMERSEHVLLAGSGADAFGARMGLDTVGPSYFYTERRWKSLERAREEESSGSLLQRHPAEKERKWGTVGAVALDRSGNLAAGTSTGGMTNKRWNRIGDAPLIGSGTYADNRSCAVSCTGHGEYFIRHVAAHDLAARIRYAGVELEDAARQVIFDELLPAGGLGGLIAVDTLGRIALPYNTAGMYRGWVRPGERSIAIWED